MKLYAIGGKEKGQHSPDEWHMFECARVLEVSLPTHRVSVRFDYVSPSHVCPAANPSMVFKAGHLAADTLHVCTQTELLELDLNTFTPTNYSSLPCFNDLHHVRPHPLTGNLLVANTGLDSVLELSREGKILQQWSTTGTPTWERFSPEVDYRRISTTKPHLSHPNFIFFLRGDPWVTRFVQRDAARLANASEAISLGPSGVHDGETNGDHVYFTRVDGHIVQVDPVSRTVTKTWDLYRMTPSPGLLGWCRGLRVLDNNRVAVGFTRIRRTKYSDNLAWLKNRASWIKTRLTHPTRIAIYDLSTAGLVEEIDLEPHGLDAIFSIHAP